MKKKIVGYLVIVGVLLFGIIGGVGILVFVVMNILVVDQFVKMVKKDLDDVIK